jgi:sugar/nucleoside kinase (ribokinase family)
MKIAVIGTPNRDSLILPDGKKITAWGGIIYNILPLAHYLRGQGTVLPICAVGEDASEDFIPLLRRFDNVLLDGVVKVPVRQNRVTLRCISQDDKEETAELYLPPLEYSHVGHHLKDVDALLINFTSGRDLTREALRQIRKTYKGPILLDLHSLTLSEPDTRGRRRLIALRDWQEWLEGMDYVQFTWSEAISLTGGNKTTFAGLVDVADWLLEHGAKGIIVTRGEHGVYYFHADEQGILKEEISAFPLQTIVDTTGCGDVFSAAFLFHLLRWGHEGLQSARFATRASALKATFSGIDPWLNG